MSQQQLIQAPDQVQDIWNYWTQYSRDQLQLIDLLWDYQEKAQQWRKYEPDQQYHGALDQALQYQLGWSPEKFETVRDQLLDMENPVLERTPSGRLQLTW